MSAKDNKGFMNEISNYDDLRKILRSLYLYGCLSVSDLKDSKFLNISDRSIKDYLRRIDNYMTSGQFMDNSPLSVHNLPDRNTDKKSKYFVPDIFAFPYNILASSFRQHSIDTNDLIFYLYLLECFPQNLDDEEPDSPYEEPEFIYDLPDSTQKKIKKIIESSEHSFSIEGPIADISKDSFSLEDLYGEFTSFYESNKELISIYENKPFDSDAKFPMSPETCRKRLFELVDLGILEYTSTDDKKDMFRFSPNILSEENFGSAKNLRNTLKTLEEYTKFLCNYSCISVPGYFLLNKIDIKLNSFDYENANENPPIQANELFFYENSRSQNLIDDDVLWFLFKSIDNCDAISFMYQTETLDGASKMLFLPIKIVIEQQYGRHYVFGLVYSKKHGYHSGDFQMLRIERIYSPQITDEVPSDAKFWFLGNDTNRLSDLHSALNAIYIQETSKSWNTHFSGESYTVKAKFHFGNSNRDKYLLSYLQKAKRSGILSGPDSDGNYDYLVEVAQPAEMIPWLNSFGNTVTLDKDTNTKFYEQFGSQAKEIKNLYESI